MARIDGSVQGNSNKYGFYIDWWEDGINIGNNTSNVTVVAYLVQKTSYWFDTVSNKDHYIEINGNRYNWTTPVRLNVGSGNSMEIGRHTVTVPHNADGSKNINISAQVNTGTPGTNYPGQCNASGNVVLTQIPRSSKLSNITDFTIEDGAQVNVTKYYSGFTDILEVKIGSTVIKTISNFESSKVTFSANELNTIYNLTKTSNTASFTFNLTTKNGTTVIGADSKSSVGTISGTGRSPAFSNFTYADINTTTVALTGNNQKLIKGYSNVEVVINSSNKANGNKGATITKYRLECGSLSTEGAYADSITLNLDNVASGSIVVKAIDSRQNSTTVVKTATLLPYSNPILKTLEMSRDGGTSTTCTIKASGAYDTSNFGVVVNIVTKIEYKKNTGAWTDCTNLFTIEEGDVNTISSAKIAGFAVGTQYVVQLKITDRLGVSNIKQVEISSGDSTLVLNTIRKLIGVGKIPNKNFPKRKSRGIRINNWKKHNCKWRSYKKLCKWI